MSHAQAFRHPDESLAGLGLHWGHGCACANKPNRKASNSSPHHKKRKCHYPSAPSKFDLVLNTPNKKTLVFPTARSPRPPPLVLIKHILPYLLNASHASGAGPLLSRQWLFLVWPHGIRLLEWTSLRSTLPQFHSVGTRQSPRIGIFNKCHCWRSREEMLGLKGA